MRKTALFLLTILTVCAAAPSEAYNFRKGGWCNKIKWGSDPLMQTVNVSFNSHFKRSSVYDPSNAIEDLAGQSLDFGWALYNGTDVKKGNNRNEIYFAKLSVLGKGEYAGLARVRDNIATCRILEADVIFDSDDDWVFGPPENYGKNYWDTGNVAIGFGFYVRSVAMHEMLHVAGLKHEDNTWAMMNYNNRPWTSGDTDVQMRPLPDDIRGLRVLYPEATSQTDLGIANTYVDVEDVSDSGAARQHMLCKAASGSGFSDSMFDSYCAKNQTLQVCAGDRIYTRYSMANYGTTQVDITEKYYLSPVPELNFWATKSATEWSYSLNPGRHKRQGHSFVVPNNLIPGGTYWAIVELEGDLPEWEDNNWIPMRRKITVKENCP